MNPLARFDNWLKPRMPLIERIDLLLWTFPFGFGVGALATGLYLISRK